MALELKQPEKKRTRHVITEVEYKFLNLVPGWIPELRKKAKGERMNKTYEQDIEDLDFCFVGDVRAKLGLSRNYCKIGMMDYSCELCTNCAFRFYTFEGYDEYILSLKMFEAHLQYGHGKEI